ncbi:MAG: respiratory nitrate reductase subunit beta [Steroidobacteraceae bacterium]|jgi:ethylbenzene hydroxylase subunit beta/complex iron-sulfur molybdoenzyme family reductase subunit beta|nr:respiratory nitrate reductase subunit beta [Steroidobacteraceae bacterium]
MVGRDASIGRRLNGVVRRADRQLAMVFDLNKCLGCQTCTIACKQQWTRDEGMEHMWWAVVNTQPGRGAPRDWESMGGGWDETGQARPGRLPAREELGDAWQFNQAEVLFGGAGKESFVEPKNLRGERPSWGPNWDEDQGGGEYPNSFYFYLPRICNHCTHPACLEACPRGAIYKRKEDGVVLIDEQHCRGYRFCMEACPYKRIYYNHVLDVSQKCIFCFPRLEKGVAPACARQCPGRLRFVGYLDDEQGPIHKLVHQWKVALPLHPEYGTQPNVYYVPPLSPPAVDASGKVMSSRPRIPLAYLESLFGPQVGQALAVLEAEKEKKSRGAPSELMDALIVYKWPDHIFPDFPVDPAKV